MYGDDEVVLLDEDGRPNGSASKAAVHGLDTPLHLAFSCHVLSDDGRMLLTRRALTKQAFAGVWTNAFCGHPAPGEPMEDAVRRRGLRELGLTLESLALVLPDFRYRATDASGIVENEVCPVYLTTVDADPRPAPDEVAAWRWIDSAELRAAVAADPGGFSPWLVKQFAEWPG